MCCLKENVLFIYAYYTYMHACLKDGLIDSIILTLAIDTFSNFSGFCP